MFNFINYNIREYIDSITEVKTMVLDAILNPYKVCKKYTLSSDVSEYLKYIDEEPFYIPPSFSDVKTDITMSTLKPKFLLFSAPGATGKSSLAKYISNKFNAIYWNLAKVKIGTNSFAGSILNAVSATKYSEFIEDLNSGKVLLVIDAFDEAEIVSGRKMLSQFITDISNNLTTNEIPTVFLLARTETAQYIASFCSKNNVSISHFEIGFFREESAKDFILKSISDNKKTTKPDISCVDSYYDFIKHNITTEECTSFLGYAPVLEAISAHIKSYPNRQKLISQLSTQKECISIIMKIMEDLLEREKTEKIVPAFKEKCQEKFPEFSNWDKIYSSEEQLIRIIYYILFNDTAYSNYELDFLPPPLVDEYQALIDSNLPQHPFIRSKQEPTNTGKNIDFTGPAFRDYALSSMILNPNLEGLVDTYFEECQSLSYFSSQIFFDCYMKITDKVVKADHISYVYDSFRAKATAYEYPYLQCSEICASATEDRSYVAIFGMIVGNRQTAKRDDFFSTINANKSLLRFEQLINVSIDTPNLCVIVGRTGIDARIYNSTIICKNIIWSTSNITIESYNDEECLLVAQEGFLGDTKTIDVAKAKHLKVSAPNIKAYYKLIPYNYDFEDSSKFDITKFIYALRCILVEFRTHRKDTLAKTADRIEHVTVGNSNIKRNVLEYLKSSGIIYEEGHLYKIEETKMQEKGINFNALSRMNIEEMKDTFSDFCKWLQKSNQI